MSYISEERKAISTFLPYPFKPQVPVEIAVLNGLLYYKGPNNVCIYQGGITPESISEKLGDVKYSDAVACGEDGNFYLCMKNPKGE